MTTVPASAPPETTAKADDIRRAAQRLFASRGYEATSMREIAAEVGIRAASVYHHFESKEEILWELTATALGDLAAISESELAALPPDATPLLRLCIFVRSHVAFHALNSEKAALVNRQMGGLSARHRQEAVAMRDAYQATLRAIMSDGIADGSFRVPDERVTSFTILQMGIAVSTWFRPDGTLAVDELCDVYEVLAARLVGAHAEESA